MHDAGDQEGEKWKQAKIRSMTFNVYFQTSDELQNELFDLIGFERIELIQILLESREELTSALKARKEAIKQEIFAEAACE